MMLTCRQWGIVWWVVMVGTMTGATAGETAGQTEGQGAATERAEERNEQRVHPEARELSDEVKARQKRDDEQLAQRLRQQVAQLHHQVEAPDFSQRAADLEQRLQHSDAKRVLGSSEVAGLSEQIAMARTTALQKWALRLLFRVIRCLLIFVVATFVLLKAQLTLLAGVPQVVQLYARLGPEGLRNVGIGAVIYGLVLLLQGGLQQDLLVAGSLLFSGMYLTLDQLVERGVLQERQAAWIRERGLQIGMATGGVAVLHLLVGGAWVII